MPNRILPREGIQSPANYWFLSRKKKSDQNIAGFTADFVGSVLGRTVFSPVKTLLAVLLFQYAPPNAPYLPQKRDGVLNWLRIAFALGLVSRVNSWLGRRAINRATSDKYDWPHEIQLTQAYTTNYRNIHPKIKARLPMQTSVLISRYLVPFNLSSLFVS